MVKSTVEREQRTPEPEYPMLMESNTKETEGLIVLMSSPGDGTVLVPGKSPHRIGLFAESWYMRGFRPFHGRVILEGSE